MYAFFPLAAADGKIKISGSHQNSILSNLKPSETKSFYEVHLEIRSLIFFFYSFLPNYFFAPLSHSLNGAFQVNFVESNFIQLNMPFYKYSAAIRNRVRV